jgi:hypothetical protein
MGYCLYRMTKDFREDWKKPKQRIYQEWEIKQIEEEERAKAAAALKPDGKSTPEVRK